MKKDVVGRSCETAVDSRGPWLDLDAVASVRITSEDPAYPIASVFAARSETGWKAADRGPQTIWLHFDAPQPIREIHLRFEATERRTQEFALSSSNDGGVSYREIVRQQFNFSPGGATVEEENYTPNLAGVTDLKLTIAPDISGGAVRAGLRTFLIR